MNNGLEIRIAVRRLPLSKAAIRALRHTDRYDYIVFTSKRARIFFTQELKDRRIAPPSRSRIIHVGPRHDLLAFAFTNKRILFPRSAIAPSDIVRILRSKGTIVRTVPLYTVRGVPLSPRERHALTRGKIKRLYFKSPSGITGLLRQFRGKERAQILSISALCIGTTTAQAARAAGFKKVSVTGIL